MFRGVLADVPSWGDQRDPGDVDARHPAHARPRTLRCRGAYRPAPGRIHVRREGDESRTRGARRRASRGLAHVGGAQGASRGSRQSLRPSGLELAAAVVRTYGTTQAGPLVRDERRTSPGPELPRRAVRRGRAPCARTACMDARLGQS